MNLHTRTLFCGQCGHKWEKGSPIDFEHNCIQGRLVTGLRYCVFCGRPYTEGHHCELHQLRDFWLMSGEQRQSIHFSEKKRGSES